MPSLGVVAHTPSLQSTMLKGELLGDYAHEPTEFV
jgi:hypothetical protein